MGKPTSTQRRAWKEANQDHVLAYQRDYRAAHPKKARTYSRQGHLRSRYGLTLEQYDRMLLDQQGCCLGCGRSDKKLHVDHNHATGAVRGLLCFSCNAALGCVQDDPGILVRLEEYLWIRK